MLMSRATRANVKRRMGVLFIERKYRTRYEVTESGEEVAKRIPYDEKKLLTAPVIQSALGAQFQITGLDNPGEASELALMLRAGALAAPITFVEERTVGPSLGAENIRLGTKSVQVGLALVVVFMMLYYRVFGVAAVLALSANLVLLVAIMSFLGATLTLPGIAGIVLTVGMAVDANVLIFARIREEVRGGAPPQTAIGQGFDRAVVTILDANITTLIVAIILYAIGTGPVKGLCGHAVRGDYHLDVVVHYRNESTDQFILRRSKSAGAVNWGRRRYQGRAAGGGGMNPIPFMKWRWVAIALSGLAIVTAVASLSFQQLNWGLDFTGGTLIEVAYSDSADLSSIRSVLAEEGYEGAVVVSFGTDRDVLVRLPDGYSDEQGALMVDKLRNSTDMAIELRRIEFVGPQVGDELRDDGGIAMLTALGLVMLYVAFRFQIKFALGAVFALAHDVIVTLGFFSLTGLEFDLTVLAALLAVVGYSLNDTIVVSDRIRENLRKIRRAEAIDVINISLTETLGRTLVTSLTTLLVLAALAFIRRRNDFWLRGSAASGCDRGNLLFDVRGLHHLTAARCEQRGCHGARARGSGPGGHAALSLSLGRLLGGCFRLRLTILTRGSSNDASACCYRTPHCRSHTSAPRLTNPSSIRRPRGSAAPPRRYPIR